MTNKIKTHKCPNCGEETLGSSSVCGISFVLCPDCYEKSYEPEDKGYGDDK